MSPKIQGLLALALERPRPWTGSALTEIVTATDSLRSHDLGALVQPGAFPKDTWGCHHLARVRDVGLSVFLLSAGQRMPLHDHPGMAVVFKLLAGRARLSVYDWHREGPPRSWARHLYLAEVDASDPPALVRPDFGNVHGLEALEDCAFIDLYSPPYDPEAGRPCRYYDVAEERSEGAETHARLIELSS